MCCPIIWNKEEVFKIGIDLGTVAIWRISFEDETTILAFHTSITEVSDSLINKIYSEWLYK